MNKKALRKVLGFRSGVPWKGIVAVGYYILCAFILVVCLVTPPLVPAGPWDTFLVKLSSVVIFLWMMSPAIFLSETPIRNNLPFLKKHTLLDSLAGMFIVLFLFSRVFILTEGLHTPEYKEAFNTYIEESYSGFVEAGEEPLARQNFEQIVGNNE